MRGECSAISGPGNSRLAETGCACACLISTARISSFFVQSIFPVTSNCQPLPHPLFIEAISLPQSGKIATGSAPSSYNRAMPSWPVTTISGLTPSANCAAENHGPSFFPANAKSDTVRTLHGSELVLQLQPPSTETEVVQTSPGRWTV